MDPALEIASPFRNEAKASEGNYDQAIEQITSDDARLTYWGVDVPQNRHAAAAADRAGVEAVAEAGHGERQTPCSMCGERSTTARVPKDGLYRCAACVAAQAKEGRPRAFPVGTFKCCPIITEEGVGGVAHCAGCGGWYHLRCVGLAGDGVSSGLLPQYVTLSTTKWYCMDPSCCEKVLAKQLKKKR